MALIKITVEGYKCERCEHEWIPHSKGHKPRTCPGCKTAYWETPRKNKTPKRSRRKKKDGGSNGS